jgi:hypothetical protein
MAAPAPIRTRSQQLLQRPPAAEVQAGPSLWSGVQKFPPWCGQWIVAQAPLVQVTSQAQAFEQLIVPHALLPVHTMVHCDPPLHVISPQPFASQLTRQRYPLGHVKSSPPVPLTTQVFGVLVVSQVAQ